MNVQQYYRRSFGGIDFDLTDESGWLHCWSLAKRIRTYEGDCMRIVRDSDSAELDIGWDDNFVFDKSAIASFCAGTVGRILKIYDQFGSVDLIGVGALPRIFESSQVLNFAKNNGDSGFEFDFTGNFDFSAIIQGKGRNYQAIVNRGSGNTGIAFQLTTSRLQITYYGRTPSRNSLIFTNIHESQEDKFLGYWHRFNNDVSFSAAFGGSTTPGLQDLGTETLGYTQLVANSGKSRVFANVGTGSGAPITSYQDNCNLTDYYIFSENQILNSNIYAKRYIP